MLHEEREGLNGLSRRVIGAAMQVSNTLGGEVVGQYFADLVVDDLVVVEVKNVRALEPIHEARCLNYLKSSGLHLCLLMNFNRTRLRFQRIVL